MTGWAASGRDVRTGRTPLRAVEVDRTPGKGRWIRRDGVAGTRSSGRSSPWGAWGVMAYNLQYVT